MGPTTSAVATCLSSLQFQKLVALKKNQSCGCVFLQKIANHDDFCENYRKYNI